MPKIFNKLILIIFILVIFTNPVLSNFSKYSLNPIIDNSLNSWDSNGNSMPSIVFNNNEYFLYYTGYSSINNLIRYQIGFAKSTDLISWNKNIDPIFSKLNINKDVHDQNILYDGKTYQMWYVTSENGGTTNFMIFRGTSIDGLNWIDEPTTLVFKPSSGFGSQGVSGPYVIKSRSGYEMWFSGITNGTWKIGHATSLDGINWTPDPANPVLSPQPSTYPWEGSQVGGPTVIKNATGYHMWYNTNNASLTKYSAIAYAFSTDGTHWTKPADKNPVITVGASTDWDGQFIGDGSIIDVNGSLLLFYAGYGNYNGVNSMRIGLAYEGTLPTPTPTPTPTNTPTPTPTNTPTPTPTPNLPVTKVIIIPGIGGSYNAKALLTCNTNVANNLWTTDPLATTFYAPIGQVIKQNGYTPLYFYYDWRKDPRSITADLNSFIKQNTNTNEKVYAIGHSLGGLVIRAYLEEYKMSNQIAKFVAVASPQAGSVLAYPAWSGDTVIGDISWRMMTEMVKIACRQYRFTYTNILKTYMPSLTTILPTSPYLIDNKTKLYKPITSMEAQNNWFPNNNFTPPFYGTEVYALRGTGYQTKSSIIVKPQTAADKILNRFSDGIPVSYQTSNEGDDTVLLTSSSIDGAFSKDVNATHIGSISTKLAIKEILSFLGIGISQLSAISEPIEPTSAVVLASINSGFETKDSKGKVVKDSQGLLVIPNPTGDYQVNLKTNLSTQPFFIIQLMPNNKTVVKTYNLGGLIPKSYKLKIDPLNPLLDPLK